MAQELNLGTALFAGGKKVIRSLGSEKKEICTVGPAGVGYSTHRPASVKKAAKFNGIMDIIDHILIDKDINAIASDDTVYTEYMYDGVKYKATFDGKDISYADSVPSGYGILAPVVMYALSDASDTEEFKDRFQEAVKEYEDTSVLKMSTALKLCDSFYYEVACKLVQTAKVFEEDLATETIKQGYESSLFDDMEILESLELTDLEALEGTSAHTKKSKKTTGVSSDFDSCCKGEHIIPYEWSEEQKKKIPSLETLNDFIPSERFYSILKKIEMRTGNVLDRMEMGKTGLDALGKDYINVLVVGKPGTGKTTAAYALGATTGMPTYTVAITKNTEEDTFQGMTKVVEGNFKFVSTDFLDAYTNGGIIILEEINLADPAVTMGALGQAIEAPFILMKDGYQAVRRHPMCIIVATMNIGTFGSKGVSQALSSRFKQTYVLDDPKEEDFLSIMHKQGHDEKRCKWVYDAYQKICSYLKSPSVNQEEVCLNITLRGCLGALDNMVEGDTPKEAIINTLVGKIAEVDLELAEDVKKCVVGSLPNLSL